MFTRFATIASISATSAVSGSHLNPAVSLAFGLSRKMYWGRVWTYVFLQITAGVAACGAVRVIMQKELPEIEPKSDYNLADAGLVEGIYSAMYCLVALNCIASLENNPRGFRNQSFAVAIGLVLIAGGPPCSEVSGGLLNPAITVGFCIFGGQGHHAVRTLILAAAQAAGAVGAAVLFFLVRPEELAALGINVGEGLSCHRICSAIGALNFCSRRRSQADEDSHSEDEGDVHTRPAQKARSPWAARIISELVGTYLVVLTFGLCAVATNRAQAETSGKAMLQSMVPRPNTTATASDTAQDWHTQHFQIK
ncbi:NIP1-1 [Symbiodinium sp. CCMP2592]|nr:NIP1-1 [Symbiodinium sp. CCMP2592]